jgi:hypothetical protein
LGLGIGEKTTILDTESRSAIKSTIVFNGICGRMNIGNDKNPRLNTKQIEFFVK